MTRCDNGLEPSKMAIGPWAASSACRNRAVSPEGCGPSHRQQSCVGQQSLCGHYQAVDRSGRAIAAALNARAGWRRGQSPCLPRRAKQTQSKKGPEWLTPQDNRLDLEGKIGLTRSPSMSRSTSRYRQCQKRAARDEDSHRPQSPPKKIQDIRAV